jgi:hypothetical protein
VIARRVAATVSGETFAAAATSSDHCAAEEEGGRSQHGQARRTRRALEGCQAAGVVMLHLVNDCAAGEVDDGTGGRAGAIGGQERGVIGHVVERRKASKQGATRQSCQPIVH